MMKFKAGESRDSFLASGRCGHAGVLKMGCDRCLEHDFWRAWWSQADSCGFFSRGSNWALCAAARGASHWALGGPAGSSPRRRSLRACVVLWSWTSPLTPQGLTGSPGGERGY